MAKIWVDTSATPPKSVSATKGPPDLPGDWVPLETFLQNRKKAQKPPSLSEGKKGIAKSTPPDKK